MFLQTDDVTHRNFYTEQFICADTFTLLHTEVCAQVNSYTQTPLHTDAFTQKIASVLHKDAFAQQKRHAGAFTHRTLYAEKLLHRTTFAQKKLHKKTLTQKNVSTETAQKIYTPKLLRAETLPRTTFTQKKIRTETFVHCSFYTDVFTHRCPYTKNLSHRNLCTQYAFTHNHFLHREALLPFLDRLIRVPPPK